MNINNPLLEAPESGRASNGYIISTTRKLTNEGTTETRKVEKGCAAIYCLLIYAAVHDTTCDFLFILLEFI